MNKYAEIEAGWIPGHENAFRPNAVGKIQLYDPVVKAVTSVVSSVAEAVGDVVKDVGKTVETVVKTVAENPEILVIGVAAPQLLPTIGVTGAAVAPVTAGLITASQGGDIEDIGKSALTAFVVPKVAGSTATAASEAGLQSSLANAVGGAAGGATAAALTGGNVSESALMSAIASGASAELKELAKEQGLTESTAATIGRVGGATLGGAAVGKAEDEATKAFLSELNRELGKLTQEDIGFGPGRVTPELTKNDIVGMPEDQFNRMMNALEEDLSPAEREEILAFGPQDYSLAAGTTRRPAEGMGGGGGLRAELGEIPESEDGSIDFNRILEPKETGQGLRVPRVPGLSEMGGGSGLTVPVEGGSVTEAGFVPEDQILRQIEDELYSDSNVSRQPTDLSSIQVRTTRDSPRAQARGETPGIPSRVTGEALAGILGEKEPLFGGDEDEQEAVWNRRSLRLRKALGL